jgi:hypothetical protein
MTSTGSDLGWLPRFPEFRRLDLEADKARYNRFYARFPPYADISFGSLAIWLDAVDDLEAARVDGNLVLRFTDVYRDGNTALSVLGDNVTGATMTKLFDHLRGFGITPRLIEVPEPCIAKLDGTSVEVIADRDSFEYLLSAEQHAEMRGGAFGRNRNCISAFTRTYGERLTWETLDEMPEETARELAELVESWGFTAAGAAEDADDERPVLLRSLKLFRLLDMRCLLIRLDGVPIAFTIYQLLPQEGCVITNHIKVNYDVPKTSEFMMNVLARELVAHGVHTINVEQDLGIPGLREHKERQRPVEMLKKYTVRPAQS